MTIEVLERGIPRSEKQYTGRCWGCESKLKWQRKDAITYYSGDQREGEHTTISCPVCGGTVYGY